jgi:hypothetical protein
MVAIVFIGIITAAMVRNTGSQSRAAIGHGTQLVMSSTLRSGLIATETSLMNEETAERLRGAIQVLLREDPLTDNDNRRFVFGTANERATLGAEQMFSSRLIHAEQKGNKIFGSFDVQSSKRSGGRPLGRATVFGELGNLDVTGGDGEAGRHALYIGGGSGACGEGEPDCYGATGDQGFHITGGNVAVMGNMNLQRGIKVDGDAYFGGTYRTPSNYTFDISGKYYLDTTESNIFIEHAGQREHIRNNVSEVFDPGPPPLLNIGLIPEGSRYNYSQYSWNNSGNPLWGDPVHLDAQRIDYFYNKAAAEGKLYNGHVVIEINHAGVQIPSDAGRFDNKVIFILNEEINFGTRFYESGPNSSTLIYVNAPNGRVHHFGVAGSASARKCPTCTPRTTNTSDHETNCNWRMQQEGRHQCSCGPTIWVPRPRQDHEHESWCAFHLAKNPVGNCDSWHFREQHESWCASFRGEPCSCGFADFLLFDGRYHYPNCAWVKAKLTNGQCTEDPIRYERPRQPNEHGDDCNIAKQIARTHTCSCPSCRSTCNHNASLPPPTFRGLIHVDPDNDRTQDFHWNAGTRVEGALHLTGRKSISWNGQGALLPINYNTNVLNAFAPLRRNCGKSTWDECEPQGGAITVIFPDGSDKEIHFHPFGFYFHH